MILLFFFSIFQMRKKKSISKKGCLLIINCPRHHCVRAGVRKKFQSNQYLFAFNLFPFVFYICFCPFFFFGCYNSSRVFYSYILLTSSYIFSLLDLLDPDGDDDKNKFKFFPQLTTQSRSE